MEGEANSELRGLLDLIEHTDYAATKIHGKLSQDDIFKGIVEEFSPSGRQRLMFFMLSEDGKHFVVKGHTYPANQITLIETLIRKKVMGLEIAYQKLPILHAAIEKGETYSFPSIDFVKQYFPSSLVNTVTKIVRHTNPPTLVSPIRIGGKVAGLMAIESPEVPGYMDHLRLSVKNLAKHISSAIDLANQRQSQLDSERRFRDIFDNTKDAIACIDEEGTVTAWNKAAQEMFGYSESDILGQSYSILVPEEFREDRTRMLKQVRENGFVINYESIRQRKDQRLLTVEMSVSTGSTESGDLTYTAILRNITDRKIAEQERLVRDRAMDVAQQGIIITDSTQKDNPIIDCNQTFEKLTGYSVDEVLGKNCRFLQGPETDPNIVKEIANAVKKGNDFKCEVINYKKDGTKFWNELVITGVRNSNGELVNYIGMQTDITERKSQQLELKKLSAAVEQSPASVVITDLNGKITYVNPRFEKVTGFSKEK
ncbi:MAG: PAS domain S-box protein, partial [Flavobacteriales bacterium]